MPIDFDGVADFVSFANNSIYDGLEKKSIFFRAYSDGDGNGTQPRLLWKTGAADALGWSIARNNTTHVRPNRLAFIQSATGAIGGWETDNATFNVSTEYSIGISIDISDTNNAPLFYIDGVSENVNEITAPSGSFHISDTEGLQIGKAGGSGDTWYYEGKIWDISLFNTILTPADFGSLHDSKTGGFGYPGHIFWAPFMGSDGKVVFTGVLAGTNFVYDHISGIKGTPADSPIAIPETTIALPFAYG